MGDDTKSYELDSGKTISSLDDVPEIAKIAKRQLFLNQWYRPVALAPFLLAVILGVGIFRDHSRNPILLAYTFASLLWAILIAGYAFYLLFSFRCPNCSARYGLGENCRSCGLPRHEQSPQAMFEELS
jgi:hypothetical protein